jgi:hypothetical protein
MRREMTAQALAAIRRPHTALFRVEVWRGGTRLDTSLPNGLQIFSGSSVKIDSTQKVRRQVTVQVPNSDTLWELLTVPGTELHPYRGLGIPAVGQVWCPLGRMEIDHPTIGYSPTGNLEVTGGDYRGRLEAAEFLTPAITQFGTLISSQIVAFLQDAMPTVPLLSQVTATWVIGSKVYATDRAAAIDEMTAAIGAELLWDGDGNAVLRDIPQLASTAAWTVDAGQGVMLDASRQGSVTTARNVVVVTSSAADGTPLIAPVYVWDNNPTSPTYAGPDPVNNPGGAGPFGIRVEPLTSTAITDPQQALQAGQARLAQVAGWPTSLTLSAAVNPGLEDGDTIAVQLPPDPFTGARLVEAHLVESVTVPLTVTDPQQITTRARTVTV